MKAIKLASVFAVSAVAAAISTTTFAAEPTFKGTAGLEYTSQESAKDSASSRGEVNIIGTVGSVYFDLDMEKRVVKDTSNKDKTHEILVLDEIYVTQGAVQFGDFDGSLADAAAFSAGVEEDLDDAKEDLGDKLAIRYAVNDSLKVSIEAAEGENKGALGFSYSTEVTGLTLGVSGAFQMSEGGDNNIVTAGVAVPLGMATLSSFVQVGTMAELDVLNTGLGLDVALSEQLTLAAQYYTLGGEESKGKDKTDQGVTEVTAYYAVGDVKYYASYISKEVKDSDYSVVGAKVSF